jgi:hypothetical protein
MTCPKCNSRFSGGEAVDTPIGEIRVCDRCCVWDREKKQEVPLIPCACGEDFIDLEYAHGEFSTADSVIVRSGVMWNRFCLEEFHANENQRFLDSIVDASGWAEA